MITYVINNIIYEPSAEIVQFEETPINSESNTPAAAT